MLLKSAVVADVGQIVQLSALGSEMVRGVFQFYFMAPEHTAQLSHYSSGRAGTTFSL